MQIDVIGLAHMGCDIARRPLCARLRSHHTQSFDERLLSAMRNEFGGHVDPGRRV